MTPDVLSLHDAEMRAELATPRACQSFGDDDALPDGRPRLCGSRAVTARLYMGDGCGCASTWSLLCAECAHWAMSCGPHRIQLIESAEYGLTP
jgi:hypothetical protein